MRRRKIKGQQKLGTTKETDEKMRKRNTNRRKYTLTKNNQTKTRR